MIYLLKTGIREGLMNIREKLSSFLVTLLMVSLSFMVFDIFLVVSWNLSSILRNEQENVGIELFLHQEMTEVEAVNLADLISSMEGVRSVFPATTKPMSVRPASRSPLASSISRSVPRVQE